MSYLVPGTVQWKRVIRIEKMQRIVARLRITRPSPFNQYETDNGARYVTTVPLYRSLVIDLIGN